MTDYYQREAEDYFEATVRIDPTPFLSPLAGVLKNGATILDVGCGSGRDLRWLAERGFRPTGFERSPRLAALARQHAGCPVLEGDFETFDFSTLAFDALLLVGSLVHVGRDAFPVILRGILQALVPGGWVYLTVKEGTGKRTAPDGRVFTLWTAAELEEIFSSLDLRIVDFSRSVSRLRTTDTWLGYLLQAA